MAKSARGIVTTKFEGKDFPLALTTLAICELEEEQGMGINEFLGRFEDPKKSRMKDICALFRVMMLKERPEATFADACLLVDEMRGTHEQIMLKAVQSAFPDPDGESARGK
jgi:hypothetical protein